MYTDILILGSTELNTSCLCGQAAGCCLLLLPPCVHALQAIAGAKSYPPLFKVVHVLPVQVLCDFSTSDAARSAWHRAGDP